MNFSSLKWSKWNVLVTQLLMDGSKYVLYFILYILYLHNLVIVIRVTWSMFTTLWLNLSLLNNCFQYYQYQPGVFSLVSVFLSRMSTKCPRSHNYIKFIMLTTIYRKKNCTDNIQLCLKKRDINNAVYLYHEHTSQLTDWNVSKIKSSGEYLFTVRQSAQ